MPALVVMKELGVHSVQTHLVASVWQFELHDGSIIWTMEMSTCYLRPISPLEMCAWLTPQLSTHRIFSLTTKNIDVMAETMIDAQTWEWCLNSILCMRQIQSVQEHTLETETAQVSSSVHRYSASKQLLYSLCTSMSPL